MLTKQFYIFFVFITIFFNCIEAKTINITSDTKAVLNLKKWDFDKQDIVKLNCKWGFVYDTLFEYPTQVLFDTNTCLINVPGLWNNLQKNGKPINGLGYGTYYLKVKLPKEHSFMGIKLLDAATAYKFFVNGKLIAKNGQIGKTQDISKPEYRPLAADFELDTSIINIAVQVSNFHHWKGGLWESISIGTKEQVVNARTNRLNFEYFLIGSILIMGIYHLGLYIIRRKNKLALIFSVFCFIMVWRQISTGERLILNLIDIPWIILISIEYISFYMAVPVFAIYMYMLFENGLKKWVIITAIGFSIIISLFTIFFPPHIFTQAMQLNELFVLLLGVYAFIALLKLAINKNQIAILFLIGWLLFFLTIINDILYQNEIIDTMNLSVFGLFVFIFFQAYLLSIRFSKSFADVEKLSADLNYMNQNLEDIVKTKTAELAATVTALEEKNKQLEKQQDKVLLQKDKLERKQLILEYALKKIEEKNNEVNSSINYAKRIQDAVLPSKQYLNNIFNECVLFYLPRDIVSGDFYWAKEFSNKIVLVVGDCTGHGVPGSIMSMMGVSMLNEVSNSFHLFKPIANEILNSMRENVIKTLNQKENERGDGMDMSVCIIDKKEKTIQYSGANSSIIICTKKDEKTDYKEFKGDKMPVSFYFKMKNFTNTMIDYKSGDMLYLYSDGFADQFGGKRGKKFMTKHFKDFLRSISMQPVYQQETTISTTFNSWKGIKDQVDDVIVFGVRL